MIPFKKNKEATTQQMVLFGCFQPLSKHMRRILQKALTSHKRAVKLKMLESRGK